MQLHALKYLKKLRQIFLSQVPRKCKTFFQRGYRGWATEDTWELYGYLSKVIKEGTTYLRDFGNGHPGEIDEDEWRKILNEIIYAFELAQEINEGNRELYISEFTLEQQKKFSCLTLEEFEAMNKGMKLFTEYFFDLWD
jgi:hypothetical protein